MCVITIKEGEKERRKVLLTIMVDWNGIVLACCSSRQAEVDVVVHMVDVICLRRKKEKAQLSSRIFWCEVQLALAKQTTKSNLSGIVSLSCDCAVCAQAQ